MGFSNFSKCRRSRTDACIAVALCIFSLLLNFYSIGSKSFGGDEFATLNLLKFSFSDLILAKYGADDYNPPLYFIIAKAITQLFGLQETTLRAVSAISAAIASMLFFLLVRTRFTTVVSVVLGLLFLTNPLVVNFAQFSRSYAMLLLFTVASQLSFERFLSSNSRVWMLLNCVTNLCAFSTHYYGIILIFIQFLYLLILRSRVDSAKKGAIWTWVITQVAIGMLSLIFLESFFQNVLLYLRIAQGHKEILSTQTSAASVNPLVAAGYHLLGLLVGMSVDPFDVKIPVLAFASAGFLACFGILNAFRQGKALQLFVYLSFVFLLLCVNTGLSATRLKPFYMIQAIPTVLLVIGYGISSLWQPRRYLGIAISGLMLALQLISVHYWISGNPRHVVNRTLLVPYREITKQLEERVATDDIILVFPDFAADPLAFYMKRQLPIFRLDYRGSTKLPSLPRTVWFITEPTFRGDLNKQYEEELARTHQQTNRDDYVVRTERIKSLTGIVVTSAAQSVSRWERQSNAPSSIPQN